MTNIYYTLPITPYKVVVFKSAFSLILFNTLVTGTTLCSLLSPSNIHGVKLLALWPPTKLVFVNTPACN
ncbi:hypothetical protein EB796_012097 [Bugula neritina]|uniref:Uncharacterized protein n=1 Tax=Bugula neritina TaxID=10212 RepID=A0A7J7JUH3_BUGNE|nr:hypothetical protein EB796_012097 [Bugula neritina]